MGNGTCAGGREKSTILERVDRLSVENMTVIFQNKQIITLKIRRDIKTIKVVNFKKSIFIFSRRKSTFQRI